MDGQSDAAVESIDPELCVVVVEIPKGSRTKFEIDPKGTLWLDRILSTATRYPTDYGFVQDTLAPDGDPIDALVLMEEATVPTCRVRARPIGLLLMRDGDRLDPKLLCVAPGDMLMGTLRDIAEVPTHLLDEIEHFFRVYKQLEPAKTTVTIGWDGAAAAQLAVREARTRFAAHHTGIVPHPPNEVSPLDVHLDGEQVALLRAQLDLDHRDLQHEIADTDNSVYRAALRKREALMRSILDQLGGG